MISSLHHLEFTIGLGGHVVAKIGHKRCIPWGKIKCSSLAVSFMFKLYCAPSFDSTSYKHPPPPMIPPLASNSFLLFVFLFCFVLFFSLFLLIIKCWFVFCFMLLGFCFLVHLSKFQRFLSFKVLFLSNTCFKLFCFHCVFFSNLNYIFCIIWYDHI